jgi:hypothetical protein
MNVAMISRVIVSGLMMLMIVRPSGGQSIPDTGRKGAVSVRHGETVTKASTATPSKPGTLHQQAAPGSRQKKRVKQKQEFVSHGQEADPVVGKTSSGKPVFEGARGGHYYRNERGEREYVRDFVGAKIVGKTEKGDVIYEGPKGGRFYYDSKGEKRYLKSSR